MTTNKTGRTTPSGTPARASKVRPEAPTTVASWKAATAGTLITVPSGNTCLVRTPGMGAFIKQGKIPNSLLGIVQDAMATKGQSVEDIDVASLLDDPEKLAGIIQLADSITVDCVIDPKVSAIPMDPETGFKESIPIGDDRRDPAKLYVDEVDFNDKMFIFNFVAGGSADLENFRTE